LASLLLLKSMTESVSYHVCLSRTVDYLAIIHLQCCCPPDELGVSYFIFWINVRALWSVSTTNVDSPEYTQKCFTAYIIASVSNSLAEYLFSICVCFLLKSAIG